MSGSCDPGGPEGSGRTPSAQGRRVRAWRGKGSASTYALRLAMYMVPNLLGGMKVGVVTERNGGRTRTEGNTGGRREYARSVI